MDKYERLRRTEDSWNKMRAIFMDQWQEAYEARKKQYNWWPGIGQVIDHYHAHAERMTRERWPWIRGGTA